MHYFLRAAQIQFELAFVALSRRFSRCLLVDRSVGSVHMGLGLCALELGGRIDVYVHSFEESFYVLEGMSTLMLDGQTYQLRPKAYDVVPISMPHTWLGPLSTSAR